MNRRSFRPGCVRNLRPQVGHSFNPSRSAVAAGALVVAGSIWGSSAWAADSKPQTVDRSEQV
ncbi:MAG TPA: hypothetical protein VFS47_03950, partial [Steroidobacteraceae bacterium]|nr:hypothetical protein [Steroidobacteraceae bacterium]